ncbi:hypothetical protein [Streptomyces xanthophaeus]|uniref:hypothetical protein n=1 Tax=Streptomyces xanthophaeus TaxID=67385 RepID=UPI0036464C4D
MINEERPTLRAHLTPEGRDKWVMEIRITTWDDDEHMWVTDYDETAVAVWSFDVNPARPQDPPMHAAVEALYAAGYEPGLSDVNEGGRAYWEDDGPGCVLFVQVQPS